MRHRRGADLALDRALLEVAHRDIHPDVAVEVDEDRVPALHRIEELGDAVVRLDLRRESVLAEAKGLDHLPGKPLPVNVRIRGEVRVEVADRTVHLRRHHEPVDFAGLTLEAPADDREFLADRRRRRGLPVRVREHRNLSITLRHRGDRVGHLVHRRTQHPLAVAEHERMGHVVDVLARAPEVDELRAAIERGALHLLLEKIFDGLHGSACGEEVVV